MEFSPRVLTLAAAITLAAPVIAGPVEVVLERAPIERGERHHGEVLVLERGGCLAVRTELASRVLRRVVREIAAKERAATPDGSPYAEDRERYLAALEDGRVAAEATPADGARQRQLRIELARCGEARRVEIAGRALDLAPDWIDARMRAIAADAIGLDAARLDELFGPVAATASR